MPARWPPQDAICRRLLSFRDLRAAADKPFLAQLRTLLRVARAESTPVPVAAGSQARAVDTDCESCSHQDPLLAPGQLSEPSIRHRRQIGQNLGKSTPELAAPDARPNRSSASGIDSRQRVSWRARRALSSCCSAAHSRSNADLWSALSAVRPFATPTRNPGQFDRDRAIALLEL